MTNLEKAKEIIKAHFNSARCGIYNTRSIFSDAMNTIYDENGLTVDICHDWRYFEVFGLNNEEFDELKRFYFDLLREKK